MLTVEYDRLGVRPGDQLLDIGCGAGRHAYEALRRGARVTAIDADDTEVKGVAALLEAMRDAGEVGPGGAGRAVAGDVLHLPFADATFDRVIAAELLEHVPADGAAIAELARVLRPGGTMAVTVPRWFPERVSWALSRQYHAVEGGHVRVYRRSHLLRRLRAGGLRPRGQHHAHALHSPYWWLRCAVGVQRDDHPLVRRYHQLLVWDLTHARSPLRVLDHLLNPVLGKSLVVYSEKPW